MITEHMNPRSGILTPNLSLNTDVPHAWLRPRSRPQVS